MIDVVCGIIYNTDGHVFIARRRAGKTMAGKWEFPGGKLEVGEPGRTALQRELKEEIGMEVSNIVFLGVNEHRYGSFTIRLIAYRCDFISATFMLTDHDAYEWVKPEELKNFNLAEADVPLVDLL